MFAWVLDPELWGALLTLSALEIVLGIDNLIFLSVVVDRLPVDEQAAMRKAGLLLALTFRILFLLSIVWIMRLDRPLFSVAKHAVSWRDLILIAGGLFLLYKGTQEIHAKIEGDDAHARAPAQHASFAATLVQVVLLDIVFSIDSVITAVGMADQVPVMIAAIIFAMMVMFAAANPVGNFVNNHPTVKMLALSFLLLIGMVLVADGFGAHVPKGYIYAAIGFSALVEGLNQLTRCGQVRRRAAQERTRDTQ